MRLIEIPVPSTPAAVAAREVAARYCSPALLNHSVRSWYWALGFADALGVPSADPELLHVAALLHDVGLVPVFDSHTAPFETAGGHVAWVLAAGAGWPAPRRDRLVEVIERHMWREVDPGEDPDGHLLEIATGLDISGARPDVLPADQVAEVLARHPRLTLAREFGACLTDQAARKPASQAARLVAGGLDRRLAENPLERA
ncbi:HD domain-containing protein [Amnibacterium sp. CER49]|uniref:HD domain-containing protein n=1 Tax=Amnibacterium sp. CER49 TaxID=3039161 RepID=UPI002446B510|nr:HD domain-containing protein [Amnibacterium sp. CER49]MDH2442759.1 HD domain-containing protein [Amnibacterium sp. CER49]